uniref:Uncharacterized protein n=1 Tax=Arundo donax TaxID=35708 RepID=A0A0A9EYQ4_ARUDO
MWTPTNKTDHYSTGGKQTSVVKFQSKLNQVTQRLNIRKY